MRRERKTISGSKSFAAIDNFLELDEWVSNGEKLQLQPPKPNPQFEKVMDFLNALLRLNPIERESLLYQIAGKTTRETETELKKYFKRSSHITISRKLKSGKEIIREYSPEYGDNLDRFCD